MQVKIKSKTATIRSQYKLEFNQEIEKLKVDWTQEHLKINEQHNTQITQVLKEVKALKQSSALPRAESAEPGDKISGLKTTTFNFMPGTVNTLLTFTMTLVYGVKMRMYCQFHLANRMKNTPILQVHCAIQYNPTSLIRMTKIPSLVIRQICLSVIQVIHLFNNQSTVKSQHKPRSTLTQQLSLVTPCPP